MARRPPPSPADRVADRVADRPADRLAPVLDYLGEVGYGELYLRRPAAGDGAAERAAALRVLAEEAAGCTACRLCRGRRKVVFGSGDAAADLMFIGEGPGAQEDRQGLPFVGPAGELLTRIIQAIELRRDEVYITNVVKCRPPRNRDPQEDEVAACSGFLERQIALVEPKLIVLLGKVAAQALLRTDRSLRDLRGRWHRVYGVETRVTYHPAALLRQTHYKRPTWEDMQIVRDRLRQLR
ncbi:MAG: uracil-DNA glycosylase [Acidobacteria bacterium]|nr:MAG: uracil-DNA glycosylase [Acidobacteriota bacterium]